MSSNGDPALQQFLQDLEAPGVSSESGRFTIDPERAVAMLRAQGRLSQSGPLPLLSALYAHTSGEPIGLCRRRWSFSWPAELGPLPPSVELLLATASLQTQGIEIQPGDDYVRLVAAAGAEGVAKVFSAFWDRLKFFPFTEALFPQAEPLHVATAQGVRIAFVLPPAVDPFGVFSRPGGRFVQVVRGISYPRRWALPIDAVLRDDVSRPDFSMTVIPDSARREELQAAAAAAFRLCLREELEELTSMALQLTPHNRPLPLLVRSCAYVMEQLEDQQLKEALSQRLSVTDATGHRWSLGELMSEYQRRGALLVVEPSRPEQPAATRQDRPVLLWGGQIADALAALFPQRLPGEGFLYTLSVNEAERQRLASVQAENRLGSVRLPNGTWSLLPWGDPDRAAEVEFVGPRRARETFYLDSLAPKGLRLRWESDQTVDRAARELTLDSASRAEVLVLISSGMAHHPPARETVLAAVGWAADGPDLPWERLERLASAPLLERVDGGFATLQQCLETSQRGQPLPVLADRSTSVPQRLPVPEALWHHPVFERLGIATEDVSRQFRESHWRQSGRQRWLETHAPAQPNWPQGEFLELNGHRVAQGKDKDAPTRVMFWREERPFGSITLDPEACRPGFEVLWVEDDLPGDVYWSGPEFKELLARIPLVDELCAQWAQREGETL